MPSNPNADSNNPNNPSYWPSNSHGQTGGDQYRANMNNRANQLNPNNPNYKGKK